MALTDENQALLSEWNDAKSALAQAKTREQDLRVRVVQQLSDPGRTSGTEHVDLGEGYDLTIQKRESFCVLDKSPDFYTHFLQVPVEIRQQLFKVSYDVSVGFYKSNQLSDEQRQWLSCLIEIKAGMPAAEIKAPKLAKVI